MGDLAVAAYGVGSRVDHIFLMPSIAIATGLVTVVGCFTVLGGWTWSDRLSTTV